MVQAGVDPLPPSPLAKEGDTPPPLDKNVNLD